MKKKLQMLNKESPKNWHGCVEEIILKTNYFDNVTFAPLNWV